MTQSYNPSMWLEILDIQANDKAFEFGIKAKSILYKDIISKIPSKPRIPEK